MNQKTKTPRVFSLVQRTAILVGAFVACATPARNANGRPLTNRSHGYSVEVLVNGIAAPTFRHEGETFVMGRRGERYTIRVRNHTFRRIEAVVSVDGRDVIDGQLGDYQYKRGYLVPAYGTVDIDGWRLSELQAAAFRFSSVAESYAAQMGTPRNIGVIGVAVFPERVYVPTPVRPQPLYRGGDREEKSPAPQERSTSDSELSKGRAAAAPAMAETMPSATDSLGSQPAPRRLRPGLGTEFGEAMNSSVHTVEFIRANPSNPKVVLGLRYNDRSGLIAMGIDVDDHRRYDESDLRRTANPFPETPRYATPPVGWCRQ